MDISDDMGVSKLSAKVFFKKVNYSCKQVSCSPYYVSLIVCAMKKVKYNCVFYHTIILFS